ncbi:MAG: penicillin acylase family protein, partial [Promethearchaeota archaeon]
NASSAFLPYLLAAYSSAPSSFKTATLDTAISYLSTWNYSMNADLIAPTIWRAWWEYYLKDVFNDEYENASISHLSRPSSIILENLTRYNPNSHWFDNITTPTIETRDNITLSSFSRAINALIDLAGTDITKWKWGTFHYLQFSHQIGGALGFGPYPGSGDSVTLNPSGCNMWERENGAAGHGASERMIVDFNNVTFAISCIPGGQSGNPLSSHYSDQLHQLFLTGKYHIDYLYSDKALLTDVESTLFITG